MCENSQIMSLILWDACYFLQEHNTDFLEHENDGLNTMASRILGCSEN